MKTTLLIIGWCVTGYIILIVLGLIFDKLQEIKRRNDYIEACGNTDSLESWERYNKNVYSKTLFEKMFFPVMLPVFLLYILFIASLWCISPPSRR